MCRWSKYWARNILATSSSAADGRLEGYNCQCSLGIREIRVCCTLNSCGCKCTSYVRYHDDAIQA